MYKRYYDKTIGKDICTKSTKGRLKINPFFLFLHMT